jgi:homoserine dehydrogenase
VMLEATTTDLEAGEPAATHLHLALEKGMHVAAASKGALISRSAELGALARTRGVQLRIGAATAAALPTVDFAEFCLAGAEIVRIEGIFNGTSNYVLTRMQADGSDYAEALRAARAKGIAEADPTLDVEGWDTAAKLVLIANALWGDAELQLGDVAVRGITQLDPEALKKAGRSGAVVRLIGSLWWEAQALHATVEPRALGSDHPLAHVDGAEKGATFVTDTMDRLTVVGGRSSPTGAAAALLRDVINLMRS